MGRASTRLALAAHALLAAPGRRSGQAPQDPRTILIAHRLLLGDTLMLAGLFATLRARFPHARLVSTCIPAALPLFSARPWGVEAVAWEPRHAGSLRAVQNSLGSPPDLALLPGDNRHALLARAVGARWIVGFAGDRPGWKNALCDALLPWPESPTALTDLFARLAQSAGPAPCYAAGDWPAPPVPADFSPPGPRYAVLHPGASNPLRHWPPTRWAALAARLADHGLTPVFAAGPGEQALIAAADPGGQFAAYPGNLDLAGLWHLVAGAALLVCLDSGVAHLAKLTGTPTVCLFGQGSDTLFGRGEFFRAMPFTALIEAEVHCRDQRTLFGRTLPWVRRCNRQPAACARVICIEALDVERVALACHRRLEECRHAARES